MNNTAHKYGSYGQALLITILVMVVVLTIGLAVVSRSIVQVKTSADEASSQKAFSAAEAGIDEVLKSGSQITVQQPLGNNSVISNVALNQSTSTTFLLNNNTQVLQDEGSDVWLSNYPTYTSPYTGNITIYWGSASSACNDAAVEISIISEPTVGPPPNYTISRYAYDPCASRASGNNFSAVGGGGGTLSVNGQSATYKYGTTITISNGLLARITPLYADTIVGVKGASALPSQGKIITSTGVSGNTQRKITYFQGYDSVPSELFYSLFSAQ